MSCTSTTTVRTVCLWFPFFLAGTAALWCQQHNPYPSLEVGGIGSIIGNATVPLVLPLIATPPVGSFDAAAIRLQPAAVVGASMPLSKRVGIGTRLMAQPTGTQWTSTEQLPINISNEVYLASIEHSRTHTGYRVDALAYLRVLPWYGLEVDLGVGLPLLASSNVVQTQRFTDPVGIRFDDGLLEQTTGAANIPHALPLVVELRAAWPIPIWKHLAVVPAVGMRRDLGSVFDGASWTTQQAFVGVGLRMPMWVPAQPPVPAPVRRVDTTTIRDTITIVEARSDTVLGLFSRLESLVTSDSADRIVFTEIYQRSVPRPAGFLEVSLAIDFVYANGQSLSTVAVTPTRIARIRTTPLFPIIVFDEGGTDVPERYMRNHKHVQHSVLRAVADSVRVRAIRKIDVVGYHNGTQQGAARAQLRAEAVMAALRGKGVARTAITVRNTVAPSAELDATVEMRLQPEVALRGQEREIKLVSALPELRVRPEVVSDEEIAAWRCTIQQSGQTVHEVTMPAPVPQDVRWPMGEMSMEAGESIVYTAMFAVTNVYGEERTSDAATVTVRAFVEDVESAPSRVTYEDVLIGVSANGGGQSQEKSYFLRDVYAGCTTKELDVYRVLAGGVDVFRVTTNEERKP